MSCCDLWRMKVKVKMRLFLLLSFNKKVGLVVELIDFGFYR